MGLGFLNILARMQSHMTFSLGFGASSLALASIALLMGASMHNLTLLPSWHLDVHSTCLLLHTMQRNPLPSSGLSPHLGFDITHEVLLHIDVDSLIRLRNTSTTADMWAAWELQCRLITILTPFINNRLAFITHMHLTSTIISGMEIIPFFDPSIHFTTRNTLKLYTPYNWFEVVASTLIEDEGYTVLEKKPYLTHRSRLQHSNSRAVGGYACLVKDHKYVYIQETLHPTPVAALLSSSNTAAQGYISATTFCHPYPALTSQYRALANPLFWGIEGGYNLKNDLRILRLGSGKDWEVAGSPVQWEGIEGCHGPSSALCASALRYYGDKYCVYGRLDSLHGVRAVFLQHQPLDTYVVYFTRGGYVCTPKCHPKSLVQAYLRVTLAECVSSKA